MDEIENPEKLYASLISISSISRYSVPDSLGIIGTLIDLAGQLKREEGLCHALKLGADLAPTGLFSENESTLNYFLGNAWSAIRLLRRKQDESAWEWQQEELENEIIHLRLALREPGFSCLPEVQRCQILTNLGNVLNHIGRFIEALQCWDKALGILSNFPMAYGNKGIGLFYYGRALFDDGHKALFLKAAHGQFKGAMAAAEGLEPGALECFQEYVQQIERTLSCEFLACPYVPRKFSMGRSRLEVKYREWCLENRLFLNPLNDLFLESIAARDVLLLPSIVTKMDEGPSALGFYNQMKQEFASARFLLFDGLHRQGPHFSDKGVLQYNTLDYPSYGLSIEKVKASYRISYSLFDKIAFFLNYYLNLSIPEKRVSFRSIWFVDQERKKGLFKDFQKSDNWPLRGLFWLSKDLYETDEGFKNAIEPEARELAEIRNHLEHKYLKVHEELSQKPNQESDDIRRGLIDSLPHSVGRGNFEAKSIHLMKLARAALVYLSLAVHFEEFRREKAREPGTFVAPVFPDIWEDRWKR